MVIAINPGSSDATGVFVCAIIEQKFPAAFRLDLY